MVHYICASVAQWIEERPPERDSNARTIIRAADSTQEQDTDSKDVHQPSMWKKIILRMPNTRFKMVQVKNLRGKG